MWSHRGTQSWPRATARLTEYLLKGFTMDDERLKNPSGKVQKDYFDELLEQVRAFLLPRPCLFRLHSGFHTLSSPKPPKCFSFSVAKWVTP